jgi:SAM-dependent methyltransferase
VRTVSRSRWDEAQRHERAYQEHKATSIRGSEIHLVASQTFRAHELRKRLAPFVEITSTTKVLEVGCGPHGIGFFLGDADVSAVDPLAGFYDRAFAWARDGAKVRTLEARGEDLPFAQDTFDLVISDNVLDHTMEPERVLQEVRRVLKPGGVFFLALNVSGFVGRAISLAHERFVVPWKTLDALAPHPFAFRERDVRGLVSRLGFRVEWASSTSLPSEADGATTRWTRLRRRAVERVLSMTYCEMICLPTRR